MKFDHNFTQTTATPTGRTYAADGWQAQLGLSLRQLPASGRSIVTQTTCCPPLILTRTTRPSAPRAERD